MGGGGHQDHDLGDVAAGHRGLATAAGLWWGAGIGRADQDANLSRGFSPEKVFSYYGIDSINLYNGALSLTLPIGPRYPVGDQLSYGLTLSYSSNVWDPNLRGVGPQGPGGTDRLMVPRRSSNAGLGWMISLGGDLYGAAHPSEPPTPSAFFQFESEDGAIHVFHPSLHAGEDRPCAFTRDNTYLRLCGSGGTKTIEFPDGTKRTYVRMPTPPREAKRPWDLDRYRLKWIKDRFDNWVHVEYSSTGDKWTITDSLGRTHTVNLHLELVDGENMWVLDSADLEGLNGVRSPYGFEYNEMVGGDVVLVEIDRSCKMNEGAPPNARIGVPLLRRVLLPADESGFRMSFEMPEYNTECTVGGGPKDGPGTIKALELPTGGRLEWTYTTYNFVTPDPGDPVHDIVSEAAGVHTKKVLDQNGSCAGGGSCTWTYASIGLGNGNRRTVVTTPEGDRHVSYFREQRPHRDLPQFAGWDHGLPFTTEETEAGLFLSQEVYDGPVSEENLLRSVYVAYEHDQLYEASEIGIWSQLYLQSNRRVKAQRTLYHDDKLNGVPRFTAVDNDDFDGLGHYRSVVTSGNLGGSGTHTRYSDYNEVHNLGVYELQPGTNTPVPGYTAFPPYPHPWVIGTFGSMRVEQPGSAFVSQYCFDPFTGRLERRRMQASASAPDSHDVLVVYTRDQQSVSDIRYEEHAYGGDFQAVGTAGVCNATLPPTPAYSTRHTHLYGVRAKTEPLTPEEIDPEDPDEEPLDPFGFTTLDLTIDPSTGLPTSSTDAAGVTTDYDYDKLGRLIAIEPQDEPAIGGDAWTKISYQAASGTSPARVTVTRHLNGSHSGSVLEESRYVYDPFGRVARDQRRIPGHGWSTVDTGYNALGWKSLVSERGPLGTGTGKTRFKDYDPFGRPTRIELPDFPSDNRHFIKLTYAGTRTVTREVSIGSDLDGNETRSSTTELYDNLGRLRRVKEPSGPEGQVAETTYGYDAAGRLVSVAQKDVVDDFVQNRSFVYDGRGFLTSETHPENGTTGYSEYDAAGNAGRKTTGPPHGQFDLAFVYDAAQRLTKIRLWTDNLLLKEFTYGDGTTYGDRSNNKIETAVRYNHVHHPGNGNPHTIKVAENYFYAGRGGRPSLRTTVLTVGENPPGPRFSQSWHYNQLGQVNEMEYPVCDHSGSTCSPGNDQHSRTVTFGHNLGYLTAVPGWANTISYHANGMLNEIHHANGVVYDQGRDPDWMRRPNSLGITHPLQQLTLAEGAALAADYFYTYDGAGNVKSWYDEDYRYDGVSRVLEGRDTNDQTQAYTYDVFGNIRTIITDRGGSDPSTVEFGIDRPTNRISASTYDDAGNLVLRSPYSYGYDSFSMMKTMDGGGTKNTYIYTADDERIWTVDSSASPWRETFTLRDLDGQVLRVFTTADAFDFTNPTDDLDELAWRQDYIYRDGQLLATARVAGAGETKHHFHLNHLGTPLLITGADGSTEALHSYFPFGEEIDPDEDTERMKFTGHERDFNKEGQTDDLDYMHARYYGPLMGRFLSVDPMNRYRAVTAPQQWNRYAYALGNPLSFIDPDGEETRLAVGGHTADNAFGHLSIVIDDTVYSYGTSWVSGSGDWGVDRAAFLRAQEGSRETTLLTLDVSPEQEAKLVAILNENDPREQPYSVLSHSCVTVCEKALESAGILPNASGPMQTDSAGNLLQAGSPSARTPAGLANQVQGAGLVTRQSTTGLMHPVPKLKAWWNTIEEAVTRIFQ